MRILLCLGSSAVGSGSGRRGYAGLVEDCKGDGAACFGLLGFSRSYVCIGFVGLEVESVCVN